MQQKISSEESAQGPQRSSREEACCKDKGCKCLKPRPVFACSV